MATKESQESLRYAERGVSSSKSDVHRAIKNIDKGLFPKAFCKIVPDFLTADPNYCLVMHADGAGTKSSLAYAYWRESGDMDVWRGIAQDAIVMNIDDLLCVGVTDNIMLSSTIGRNKKLIPGEVISAVIEGAENFIEQMAQFGIGIHSTGGETADVGDLVQTIIVDSTVCARIKRSEVIDNGNIKAGDVIVGLASYGKSTYEGYYNSGIGSNGLTFARHELLNSSVGESYPESFSSYISKEFVYTGSKGLTELDPISGLSWGKLLLSPTRSYAPIIKELLIKNREAIHGMVHSSGGGQTKALNFIDNLWVIKDNMLPIPHLFKEIQKESSTPWEEMYKVFNMGVRMELYVDPLAATDIIATSLKYGVDAQIIGRVEQFSGGAKVTIITEKGEYNYEK